MKTLPIKNLLSTIGMVAVLCMMYSFMHQQSSEIKSTIPTLLDRGEKIQLGKEWESVQNQYVSNRDKFELQKDYEAGLNLAYIYIREARITGEHGHYYPAALSMLDKVLSADTKNSDLYFRSLTAKAGVQLSLHEFSTALATAEQALSLNPHNAQVYMVLVDANVELGNYKKATEYADKMANMKPDLRSYARISYLREIHGDVDGAIDAMTMAVKSGYPGMEDTAWAMLTLGELYQKYNQGDKAEKVYKEILTMRENYPFAVGALGDIEYQKENTIKAEEIIKQAMDIIPEVGFYVQMAHIYKLQHRDEEFKAITNEILEMLEDDVTHGHNMNLEYADLYLELLDQPEKAEEYAMIEYQKRPQNIDTNTMLAKIYMQSGQVEKAKPYIEKAMRTHAQYPEILKMSKEI